MNIWLNHTPFQYIIFYLLPKYNIKIILSLFIFKSTFYLKDSFKLYQND